MIFEKHPIYVIIHVILGYIGFRYPTVLILTVGYQLLQYIFNTRFFVFEMLFRSGNSIEHTTLKLFEVLCGYVLAKVTQSKALDTA